MEIELAEFKDLTRKTRSSKSYLAFKRLKRKIFFTWPTFSRLSYLRELAGEEDVSEYMRRYHRPMHSMIQSVRNCPKDDWGFPRKEILNSISKAEMKKELFEWHFAEEIFNDD